MPYTLRVITCAYRRWIKIKHFERSALFFGGTTQIWTGDKGFAGLCLTTWPWCHIKFLENIRTLMFLSVLVWSGLRGSNSLPPPWQGGALPDELNPHQVGASGRNRTNDTRIFSPLLYQLSYRGKNWRPGWGSNPRPLAWQASVLTNWTTRPKWWEQQGSNLWPSACKADALPAELCSHVAGLRWLLTYYCSPATNNILSYWSCFVKTFFKNF